MPSRILPFLSATLAVLVMAGCYSPGGSGVTGQSSLAPGITEQPQSQTVPLSGTATFQVAASGAPVPSFQWERSNDAGATWYPLTGATGASFSVANASIADNQAQFHVVLADPAGSAASDPATLKVTATLGESQVEASLPPHSVPTGITVGPDGNLWFTNAGAGQIGKLDALTHQVALVNLPDPACRPLGITTGPDGNLWFTEEVNGKLGVMTTAGVLYNEYPVGAGPTGIVTGSDGHLWTTLLTSNQIAKVSTAGVVTLYTLPTPGASPTGITRSADGNVWFTEQTAARLGQISPAGAVTEWVVETPPGGVTPVPVGITTTPDGAIWYSDTANNCVGRFLPNGLAPMAMLASGFMAPQSRFHPEGLSVTIFFPLVSGADPNGLAADAEGQVWVSEQGTNQVAVITLSTPPGTTPVSYDLPAPGGLPAGLVLGPDGNIWVTLPGVNDVVMVVDSIPADTVFVEALPAAAAVVGGGVRNFQAVVLNTPSNAVTWSVLESGGGTITPDTGIYLAPATAGIYHVVATSHAATPPVAATVAVTVLAPAISAITPVNPSVQAGGSALFSAQVTGLPDNSIVWSASDGVMNAATGAWTAPNTVETVTITATSSLDPQLTATTLAFVPPSGSAPPVVATTGTPQLIASIAGSEKPS